MSLHQLMNRPIPSRCFAMLSTAFSSFVQVDGWHHEICACALALICRCLLTSEVLEDRPRLLHAEMPSERLFEASTGKSVHGDELRPAVTCEHQLPASASHGHPSHGAPSAAEGCHLRLAVAKCLSIFT